MNAVLQYNVAAGQLLHPGTLHLVIQHCDQFTGLLLADKSRKDIIYWHLYEHTQQQAAAAITTSINNLPVLIHEIEQITVVNCGLDATLIPPGLGQANGLAERLLELVQGTTDSNQLVLRTTNATPVVYSLLIASHDTLRSMLPAHASWDHILNTLHRQPTNDSAAISVNFLLQSFILSVEQNGKRLLLQQYSYQNPEDILYRILLAVQQFKFNLEEVIVILTGFVTSDSAAVKLIQQYLPIVQWGHALQYTCSVQEKMPEEHTVALAEIFLTCA